MTLLPLCMALGKSNMSKPQFAHLQNGITTHLPSSCEDQKPLVYVKHCTQLVVIIITYYYCFQHGLKGAISPTLKYRAQLCTKPTSARNVQQVILLTGTLLDGKMHFSPRTFALLISFLVLEVGASLSPVCDLLFRCCKVPAVLPCLM